MNTLEIARDLSQNLKTRQHFKGVFPADCLPKSKLKKPAFVVANTDNANQEGTHWVAFYFPKVGKGEYFDSFGNGPINTDFIKFLQKNCSSYIKNDQRLQGDFSTYCGQFCCMYLYYRCVGKTLKQFLQLFTSTKFNFNDNKVIHLYHKFYHTPDGEGRRKKGNAHKMYQVGGRKKNFLPYIQICRPRLGGLNVL